MGGSLFISYFLATSDFSAEVLGTAFDLEESKVIISGYPRNYEPLISNSLKFIPEHEKKQFERIEEFKNNGYAIIGYFPTFRDKHETLIFGSDDLKELESFFDFCEKLNIKVVSKFHFAGNTDNFDHIKSHKAFMNLSSESDVYTFLNQIDVLITEYSSIYYDYLLWERPIIFFPYDLEYYRDHDRGLLFNYDEYTPGPKVYSLIELQKLLSSGLSEFQIVYRDKYATEAKKICNKVFGMPKTMMIEHLINQIKKL